MASVGKNIFPSIPGGALTASDVSNANEANGPVFLNEDGNIEATLVIRQGTDAALGTPENGELVYSTTRSVLLKGNGVTAAASLSGIGGGGASSDDVSVDYAEAWSHTTTSDPDTDAAMADLLPVPAVNAASWAYEVTIIGQDETQVDAKVYTRRFVVTRSGGTCAMDGTVTTVGTDSGAYTGTISTISVSNSGVEVNVQDHGSGVSQWGLHARITKFLWVP